MLQALGHVPAQGVEHDGVSPGSGSQFPVLSSQWIRRWSSVRIVFVWMSFCFAYFVYGLFAAPDRGAIGMAAWSCKDGDCRKFGSSDFFDYWIVNKLASCTGVRSRLQLQLYMLVFHDARGRGELSAAR